MTYYEVKNRINPSIYTVSAGDNLFTICNILYGSYAGIYLDSLIRCNDIYDWLNLSVGMHIKYYPASVIEEVKECSYL